MRHPSLQFPEPIADRVDCSPVWGRRIFHRFNEGGIDAIWWEVVLRPSGECSQRLDATADRPAVPLPPKQRGVTGMSIVPQRLNVILQHIHGHQLAIGPQWLIELHPVFLAFDIFIFMPVDRRLARDGLGGSRIKEAAPGAACVRRSIRAPSASGWDRRSAVRPRRPRDGDSGSEQSQPKPPRIQAALHACNDQ